ncbi:MAG: molybdopterin-dependent oxidoreductase [candidate division WOR-3 bacterium]|nr:molybdopterin-dependent oxidoreductase [candidate division WOR-3 bacterium]
MKFQNYKIIGLGLTLAILLIAGTIWLNTDSKQDSQKKTTVLKSLEIREYEGINLSSINDFRENSIKGPQRVNKDDYRLKITGLVDESKIYTYDEVINNHQHYKKVVSLDCVEGWSAKILWEGILVKDLINQSKPLSNAKIIIFHAHDGYTTSFPIDYIMKNDIIMAYKMNNVTLPPERGFPFELVAESKWGYKWIKWITEIELSADTTYRGYWEKRGYSNDCSLDKDFIEKYRKE